MRRLTDVQRTDNGHIVSYWRHEVLRTIGDQLPRFIDNLWLQNCLNETIKEVSILKPKGIDFGFSTNIKQQLKFTEILDSLFSG